MSDLISRDDAIRELSGVCSNWEDDAKVAEIINALPSAEAEPSLKAIKRQIDEHWYLDPPSADADVYEDYEHATLVDIKEPLRASAEAVQGEWIRKYDDKINCYWYECDQCGEYRPRNQFGHEYNANFCPNCGARMKGGDLE